MRPTEDVAADKIRLTAKLLELTSEAMMAILGFEYPADKTLSSFFRAHPQLGHAERGFIAETVYAGLRHKRLLDLVLEETGMGQAVGYARARRFILATLLRARGMNARELEGAVRREESEQLAALKTAARGELPLAVECDLPDWVMARLLPVYGEEQLRALAQALQQPAALDLRVNLLKADRDRAQASLRESGIETQATPYASSGLRVQGKPALQRDPLFQRGDIEVQDEGSQLLIHLLAPRRGEMVADFCAGAGGKTLAIASAMRSSGRVYAFDVSDKRLAKLKTRMARSGASNVDVRHIASERDPKLGRLAQKFDRVLVDAPCSGLGTLRRNPDLKWRQKEEALPELHAKQAAILAAAAKLVKKDGRLVYATCSLLPEENEAVIADFLAAHPDFKLVPVEEILRAQQIELPAWGPSDGMLRLLPHIHRTDGFFAAAMQRQVLD
jgi:16S rRNA (cytosine967-C5)-methyltransferase